MSPIAMLRALLVAPVLFAAGPASANLIVNGDFSAGNSGFTTSYAYSPGTNSTERQYTIRTDPFPWNPNFVTIGDRTTGSGNMMVINGATTPDVPVWISQSITVAPNTGYFFDAFVTSVCCSMATGFVSPTLRFTANGEALGDITVSSKTPGTWEGFSKTWNSGSSTSVVLSLVNLQTEAGGNDFALDDLSLSTASTIAVPLPGGLPLMLGGLAVIGWIARRTGKA